MRSVSILARTTLMLIGFAAAFAGPSAVPHGPGVSLLPAAEAATADKKTSKKRAGKPPKEAAKPAKPVGIWNYGRDEDAFILQYRAPGGDAPLLVATCWPGAGLFQVVAELSPPKAQTGDPVRLMLSNGKVAVEFAASVFPSVTEGKRAVEAQVRLEPKLIELFKVADQLKIAVAGTSTLLPLAGAQKRLPDFEKACLRATIVPGDKTPAAGG